MSWALKAIHTHAWDFWFARASVALVAGLQLLMFNDLTIGPRWLAPGLEIALLLPLSAATAWTQASAREARTDHHWRRVAWERRMIRRAALALTALITVINLGALVALIHALLAGSATKIGQTLLLDALNIWATNVIVFALWFWSIDHGGPAARGLIETEKCDFLYPQMTIGQPREPCTWSPGFVDYLYLSFTNATAFSPTDTMPLSRRAKMLMMIESAISLLTIALVAARAVNILA
ncbi:MAG: hypothetical protein V4610_04645 [Pseudomonadota bacterium]|jgi:uncharacterized membrane protein|uniref:Mlr1763 protein n=1 Tax=hydrothermal vent metagenome TaxID=652676 RepID=A0A161K0I9_9ZZZZ